MIFLSGFLIIGLNVSWHYTPPPEDVPADYRFAWDNRGFTKLANIVHMYGGNQLEEQITNIRREKDCDLGSIIDSVIENYGNISMEALFIEEITDESLETAARHYFRIRFCDFNTEVVQFYENLFKQFPLESVLKTLARILLVANEKKLRKGFNNNFSFTF